jgi:leader peptidase (prepilin peptidase)/N-methyltransferase
MQFFDLLGSNPALWLITSGTVGLLIGSFLNVVINRLPRMMEAGWRQECSALLEVDPGLEEPVTLSKPASHCPSCKTPIKPWQNIPVLSYLWLRGQCGTCKAAISIQYPMIELAAGGLAVWAAAHYGFGWQAGMAMVLAWALLALAAIDLKTQLLPDSIVLPLLWLGLLLNLFNLYVPIADAVVGAMAGYMSLWLVYQGFRLVTGKEGMGFGDFKLFAALGAWMGWQQLPWFILASSAVGAVVGITLLLSKRLSQDQPIPFGPYLAAAGWLAILYGEDFSRWYLNQF